jgi:uridine kinase
MDFSRGGMKRSLEKWDNHPMERSDVLAELTRLIITVDCLHPVRVAIDGVDASGKTTLAGELAVALQHAARPVIRASIDAFHNPRGIRYRAGGESPNGYYRDSFDADALKLLLLVPLGPGGDRIYRTSAFNFRTDSPAPAPPLQALPGSILLFDGVFLLRPDLVEFWDFKIFVHADFDVILRRALLRDRDLFGTPEEIEARYRARYIPGQKIYLEQCDPQSHADVIVKNNDPLRPELRFSPFPKD